VPSLEVATLARRQASFLAIDIADRDSGVTGVWW
jgi:hypothetical protein